MSIMIRKWLTILRRSTSESPFIGHLSRRLCRIGHSPVESKEAQSGAGSAEKCDEALPMICTAKLATTAMIGRRQTK